ncbi:MAG: inner membrane protein YiaA [Moraxella sp.]|nr:inner membrane protein YiaA [Moraxella sp.]
MKNLVLKPTPAYLGMSWLMLGVGVCGYLLGLWNTQMQLNEKGYYFAVIALGLYAAISLQKTIRDKAEGIPTTNLYFMISWAALGLSLVLITIGLWNATLALSEKGYYFMAFCLSLFSVITIQKNTRDVINYNKLADNYNLSDDTQTYHQDKNNPSDFE